MPSAPFSFLDRRSFIQSSMVGGALGQLGGDVNAAAAETDRKVKSMFRNGVIEMGLPASGNVDPRLEPIDRMLAAFVLLFRIPGASMAVAKNGRLLYSRGVGFSDLEAQQSVQPTSRFRIASVSKPITAIAVLKLAEQGKLRLEDKLVEILPIEPYPNAPGEIESRWNQITVEHLLQHRGGWDRDLSFDPMFHARVIINVSGTEPPILQEQIIRFMRKIPLDFAPGQRMAYSNFGYCLLGRIIEKVTGKSYFEAVSELVLTPAGTKSMQLGKTRLADRAEDEVRYDSPEEPTGETVFDRSGEKVAQPYGAWSIEAMDAHGGWIATAEDLVRVSSSLYRKSPAPLLRPGMLQKMLASPGERFEVENGPRRPRAYWGYGWKVTPVDGRNKNHFHTGSLPGTSALLVSRWDGFQWAVLMNTRHMPNGEHPANAIDRLIHNAVDSITEWPEGEPLWV